MFYYNNKVTNKVTKRLPKLSNKEIYFTLLSNIISNSTKYNLSNSFHGQTSFMNTIFSVLISGVKLLLIHSWFKKCWWIAGYIFSILYNLTHFSLPLNPAINRWQNGQRTKYCGLDEKNKKSLKPNFYFIASFPKFR